MYREYNPNPRGARVGDCSVRAIAKALGKNWNEAYMDLAIRGLLMADMPNADRVWGNLLYRHGYSRHMIPDTCPDCYTVEQFCDDHRHGKYVLALSGHVLTAEDGCYFDSWDSGAETPIYFWTNEEGL